MSTTASLADGLDVRSFHVVFRIERRLHRIDRWRLPVAHGVPIAAIGHAALVLLLVIAAGRLPGLGAVIAMLPAPASYVVIPAICAAGLTRLRIDGRPAHRHLIARARHRLRPSTTAADRAVTRGRLHLHDATLLAHGPERPGWPQAVVTGPAVVQLCAPAHAQPRGRTLHLTPRPGRPLTSPPTLRLSAGQRLRLGDRR